MNEEKVIELAREIGREIQETETYLNFRKAKEVMDNDKNLEELICELNLKKVQINNEIGKEERNEEKIENLNKDLRKVYEKIVESDIMKEYNEMSQKINLLIRQVQNIIVSSSEGQNPDEIELLTSDCTHDCSTCGGCH